MATRFLALVTVVVDDYDTAIAHYVDDLGFTLLEDTPLGADKRWVRVAPSAGAQTALLLARASDAAQQARIGDQTGGRVGFFLYTDDLARDHAAMGARGVRFQEAPRSEPYGKVVVFADRYGNLWDLLEPAA
ncbi:VOC family protein [Pseudoxanthomonas composti]|uniref:VOC family protein n=1 Tax=Pseudoxanthomonas composti TaxID=2137479 RepID=A0A4Q1JTF9_9GAMM|nr:VOC family protein [Pseudoxanthomonas composti]RXR04248.1 VOC family protein [Pseudoxanthomonas composti]